MTDKEKLNAIRAEVQNYIDTAHKAHTNITEGNFAHLLSFINSLQEEPVSEDLEEEFNHFHENHRHTFRNLELLEWGLDIARHFANWQKQKDKETIELAEDHAMLAGMEKMKEQMIKDAIPANILTNQYGNKYIQSWSGLKQYDKYKNGDEVKIIIIKKE